MRIDLQDIYRANPKAFIVAAALVVGAFASLVIIGVSGGHKSAAKMRTGVHATALGTTPTATRTVASNGVTVPDPSYHPSYAKNVPSSPIDQSLASEYGAGGSGAAALESVQPLSPAWTTAYPQIPSTATQNEQSYAVAFLQALLDRNYRTQSRQDLARWISAESADEMFPGVPAQAGDHALYGELLEPRTLGAPFTVVPAANVWGADAKAGVTQHVYNLLAHPDPQWAALVSKGFTSADPLMGAEDVTGVIATTRDGRPSTTRHFSAEVMLGSALYHPGYGSWGLAQWVVN